MENILQYAKTIAAFLGAVLTSVSAVIPDAPLWLTITLAVLSAVAVFAIPNAPTKMQKKEVIEEAIANSVLLDSPRHAAE